MRSWAVVHAQILGLLISFLNKPLSGAWAPHYQTKHTRKGINLFATVSSTDKSNPVRTNDVLHSLLGEFGFDRRQKCLKATELPVIAEVYVDGKLELCEIAAFRPTKQLTLEINSLSDGSSLVVDFGQVTTVWRTEQRFDSAGTIYDKIDDEWNQFPVGSMESALDGLYMSYVGRARSTSKKSLSKKQIGKLVSTIQSDLERQHADNVLRQLIKSGNACSRLLDSAVTAKSLYNLNKRPSNLQQAVAAQLLAKDAEAGGRFKRMSCTFVEKRTSLDDGEERVESISFVNGGWLVVDKSVRAGSEARKFAERVRATDSAGCATIQEEDRQEGWTISDERILQRLECLAMGELFGPNKDRNTTAPDSDLEVDVRESLKALGAPVTPEGARDVLIKIGRWSQTLASGGKGPRAQPWSPTILNASKWYEKEHLSISKANAIKAGYSDLTKFPFVCIDAPRTTFRDDAIGVRPRASTGRKIIGSSRWEILITIADVSNIYSEVEDTDTTSSELFKVLREAAASRGISRYDLPIGPLHLMPPMVLHALSFNTIPPSGNDNKDKHIRYNRCVTIWAYIDEQTGQLLDAGIERSVISPPLGLSYQQATDLLQRKLDTRHEALLETSEKVLAIADRVVTAWSEQRLQKSEAAQKREQRLAVKEFVTKQQLQHRSNSRQGKGDGFQRTQGHKLVDACLDLYSVVAIGLLRRKKAPYPQQAGSSRTRGGRMGTAPLRRYVDGMAQRQLLSVLCGYGSPPMSKEECKLVSEEATNAYNAVSNIRSVKQTQAPNNLSNQRSAVHSLKLHLSDAKQRVVPAVSTGRGNEVVIAGVGALAKCRGVKGSLKPGEKILVKVDKIDAQSGNVGVSLAS